LASLRPDDLAVPIARHQFPLGVAAGGLALLLYAGTRLQRVAAVLAMHWNWSGLDVADRRSAGDHQRRRKRSARRNRAVSTEELAAALPKPTTPAAWRLRKQLLEFVAVQAQQPKDGERLLGSSEVLESIIGKFKHLAGERGQHGLTGMVLGIGALLGKLAVQTVQTALTKITTGEVWNWRRAHLGSTVQSVRQRIRLALHPEQNQKTEHPETG
jgi:hypothetical protein